MTLKEVGFRALYKQFAAFSITPDLREGVKGFPDADNANCVLVYGYVDHERGLSLEVLACGRKDKKGYYFFDSNDEIRSFIRGELIEDEQFVLFDDTDQDLTKRYKNKLDSLQVYDHSDEISKTRDMTFLDDCRESVYVDDVLVYLIKEGLTPERCWTRIEGLGDHYFVGILQNEPSQDFGYHIGDMIGFFVQKTSEDAIICISDMNPKQRYTQDDLADGTVLESAIATFNNDRTQEHFIDVIEILRDSNVWVPCNALLSERDQKMWNKAIEEAGDNLDALVGQSFVNQDHVRLVPDILQNGDSFFFPAFSNVDAMGEYGNGFSKVEHSFLEIIQLAKNNEKDVSGIVINAFTEPFVLDKELFDLVESSKSSL